MTLSPQERRVCEAIQTRADALLADLRTHVELPTGGRNTAALDRTRTLLCERLRTLGADVQSVPGVARPDWLYGESLGSEPLPTAVCRRTLGGSREVLLSGHLDTVHDPAGPFLRLECTPDDQIAKGPGCVDMKGGLVIAMAALEALEFCGERLSWTFLLNSDEETGSYHSAPAIQQEAARVAAAGGVGIALEPAAVGGGLVVERAGSAQFMVEVRGRAAHVGRDFASGISAVDALCEIVLKIRALARASEGLIVNIGPLEGGRATNVVPDRACAWGNARFAVPSQIEAFEAAMRSLEGKTQSGASVQVFMNVGRPAKPKTAQVERFAALVQQAAADLGQPMTLTSTAGVCDGNLMQAVGLPTLDTLGVRGGGLHTPDEWIELPSLVERCQLLAVTMMRVSRANLG